MAAPKTAMQRFLDGIERVGNMVPHPVVIFLILIAIVIVLSHIFSLFGVAVTLQRIDPDTQKIETTTTALRSLLDSDGIRFLYTSLVPNFMNFTAVGLMIAAMIGAGVAEESGLVNALIRKLVLVSPSWALTYILAFAGILSSIAADAGYLVLLPLAGVAYASVGTLLTYLLGRPLVRLNQDRLSNEADFRFGLMGMRGGPSQPRGDDERQRDLLRRFARVIATWRQLMLRTRRLSFLTAEPISPNLVKLL